eukprot:gene21570-26495_t
MWQIEGPKEEELRELSIASLANLRGNVSDDILSDLEEFCSWPDPDGLSDWTPGGAMFFSLTVITTIGYGSFAPITQDGRLFTALYAVFGISVVGHLRGAHMRTVLRSQAAAAEEYFAEGMFSAPDRPKDLSKARAAAWEDAFDRWYGDDEEMRADALPGLIHDLLDDDADPALVDHVVAQVDPHGTGRISRAGVVLALMQY